MFGLCKHVGMIQLAISHPAWLQSVVRPCHFFEVVQVEVQVHVVFERLYMLLFFEYASISIFTTCWSYLYFYSAILNIIIGIIRYNHSQFCILNINIISIFFLIFHFDFHFGSFSVKSHFYLHNVCMISGSVRSCVWGICAHGNLLDLKMIHVKKTDVWR